MINPAHYYNIRHVTKFRYDAPIYENVMEARMQPLSDDAQQCLTFQLHLRPTARAYSFQDHLGNVVHHFNIPGLHSELTIRADASVRLQPVPALPTEMSADDWQRIDNMVTTQEYWEMRSPSFFTEPTAALAALADELQVRRQADPLTALCKLNSALNRTIAYQPKSTRVDSPIDEAIQQRAGVCQDYTHIMLALVRNYLNLPCRYVSGYLYHRQNDRSVADATHAWVEVLLPEWGWVGFDPTNDLLAGERHIRAAIGRDYQDVPPTRGIFKGKADSNLSVSVQVRKAEDTDFQDLNLLELGPEQTLSPQVLPMDLFLQQQQQQQQQ